MRELTKAQNKELIELYNQGKNDYEVANVLHLGRNRLREWRKNNEIASKTNKKGLLASSCLSILKDLKDGGTLTTIGAAYGVNRSSIQKLLKRSGFSYKVRSRSHPSWASSYKLTPYQISFLVGDMLGDGGLVPVSVHTAYYHSAHSMVQKSFVDWKYSVLSPLSCRTKDWTLWDEETEQIFHYTGMATWSNCDLRYWWSKFYPSGCGNKSPGADVVEYLDWLGMAVWFMGDGCRDRNQVHFSVGLDVNLPPIVDAMNYKFHIDAESRKYEKEWHLFIGNKKLFFDNVAQYLLPHFDYKNPFRTLRIVKI